MNVKAVFQSAKINPATIVKMILNQNKIQELVRTFEQQQLNPKSFSRDAETVVCSYCKPEENILCKKHSLLQRITARDDWALVSNFVSVENVSGPYVAQTDIVFVGNVRGVGRSVLAINCPYINTSKNEHGKLDLAYTYRIIPFTFSGVDISVENTISLDFLNVIKHRSLEFVFTNLDESYRMVLSRGEYKANIFEQTACAFDTPGNEENDEENIEDTHGMEYDVQNHTMGDDEC